MPTAREDYARVPIEQRLRRLERGPDDLAAVIRGRTDAALSRRPDATNWSAKEVICHFRDAEEMFLDRLRRVLTMQEPSLPEATPDRWAQEKGYVDSDIGAALGAFGRLREQSTSLLKILSPGQWKRGGVHPKRGRLTVDDIVAHMAWHDDNHLDQLRRALEGRA